MSAGTSVGTGSAIKIAMRPPHPGEFVRDEVLGPLAMSISKAAEVLGVRRASLSELVNGKVPLKPEMALRIEKAFGISMETLLRMQAWFDTCDMRARSDQIVVDRYDPATAA